MNDLVKNINGKVVVSSKDVADKFGKVHRNVMRDIKNLDCSWGFRSVNFEQSSYISQQNKELPCVEMTRDGFCFLVMGFTGKKGGEWKEKYINAFNEMESSLSSTISVMEECNKALASLSADEAIASNCGRGLAKWKKVKDLHIKKIEKLQDAAQLVLGIK